MLFKKHLLMNENNGGETISGYGSTPPETTTNTPPPQATGSVANNTEVSSTPEASASTSTGTPASSNTPEKTEPSSGYGEGTEKKPVEQKEKPAETPVEVVEEKALELDLKGLKEENISLIRKFAKDHKLTKEQAQALVDDHQIGEANIAKAKEEFKLEVQKHHKAWEKELRDDADFGGANFDKSVHNINRLINENLPGVKKILTGDGKRLPPSVMRDLKSLAERLYGEKSHVDGGTPSTNEKSSPLDFYNKT